MKYEYIEKLPFARYAIDVGWAYLESTLKQFDDGHGLDLDPDFQRGYVWAEKQKTEYILLADGRRNEVSCRN